MPSLCLTSVKALDSHWTLVAEPPGTLLLKSRDLAPRAAGAARKWGLRRRWGGNQMRVRQAPDAAGGEIARASRPLNLMQFFFSSAGRISRVFFPCPYLNSNLGDFKSANRKTSFICRFYFSSSKSSFRNLPSGRTDFNYAIAYQS
ncbi:hypothetical protein CEP53_003352 [Fusarium sp. AF-6]|nr:hypothetical protein CEP53_003352 [Fusarium sp. AF-6]